MKLTTLSRMPFSQNAAWPELARLDPRVARMFMLLVVPLSLLPPAMIYMAGSHYGDAFIAGLGHRPWGTIASVIFIGEIISVSLMGWLIRQVAETWHGHISYQNAYLLAAIAPIPLWLSSLGLFFASMALNVVLSFAALGLSCCLIYQGVHSLCEVKEDIEAAAITQVVFGAGLIVWALLLSPLILPIY
jgi:hypothetical protein